MLIGYLIKKGLLLKEILIADKNLFSNTGRYIITINPAIIFNIVRDWLILSYSLISVFFREKKIINGGSIKLVE